ncbi:MAG: hypothetical protein Q7J48_05280 [Nocardioides sp.]|nr:hypothetical protein [Nocardioides sp.]
MKTLQVLAALTLLAAGVTPAYGGVEAYECRGMPATIVGGPDLPSAELKGTEGDDVIVSNGSLTVEGFGGNDTICVTGDRSTGTWAGAGNDVVDASALPASAMSEVVLGGGDDTYLGHSGTDRVTTDLGSYSAAVGRGSDTVRTGDGRDFVDTGMEGLPDEDTIDVGAGDDFVRMRGTSTGSISITGASGRDKVQWPWSGGPRQWTFDNRQGRVTRGGVVVGEWTGLEDFDLLSLSNHDVDFIGSDQAEAVRVSRYFGAQTGSIRAAMAGGDDLLWVNASQQLVLDGGSGRDGLDYRAATANDPAVTMDLRAGSVIRGGTVVGRSTSFEDAVLTAPRLSRLIGTRGPNELMLRACHGRVDGLRGNDRLVTSTKGMTCSGSSVKGAQLYGGPGDDRLYGSTYRDRLIGGTARDTANGGPSSDLCRAERRTSCERR